MVAICEFKMPEKFEIAGKDLDDRFAKSLIDKIVLNLKTEKAVLSSVESYCDIEDKEKYSKIPENNTFVKLILSLDEHQIQDYKTYDNLIIDKAISCFQEDELYISKYWQNGDEEHIFFETEF